MIVEGEMGNPEVYYTGLGVEENWPALNGDMHYLYKDWDFENWKITGYSDSVIKEK